MPRVYHCPIDGCTTTFPGLGPLRRHAKEVHVTCTCGWVGVSIHQHRSQRVKAALREFPETRSAEVAEVGGAERRRHTVAAYIERPA